MKTAWIAFVLSTTALAPAAAAETAASRSVLDLAWLAGSWCAESDGATAEEHWVAPHGGVLLGVHRDVRPGRGTFFEYLRVVREDGALVYYASPAGRPATPFTLVELDGMRAVFANPEHDFPQRILYESDGETLTSTIEGEVDGEMRSSGWRWKKDACGFLAGAAAVSD